MKKCLFSVMLWVLASGNAFAFLGVGDVTFDPPVHAELISLFDQTMAIYHTTLNELYRLQGVEATLRSAQRDAKTIMNGSFIRYEDLAMPMGIPQSMGRYLGTVQGLAQTGADADGYYRQQVRRLQDLLRLKWILRGTSQDVRLSATHLGEKTSGDVTAQSTAALAALSAERTQSERVRAIRRAAERHNDQRLPEQAVALYQAFAAAP